MHYCPRRMTLLFDHEGHSVDDTAFEALLFERQSTELYFISAGNATKAAGQDS